MYKVLVANEAIRLEIPINECARKGFALMKFASVGVAGCGHEYVAIMHKPDAAPSPFMTANDFLAAMDASAEKMQSMADHADEVLHEEARQYGAGQ